MMSSEIFAFIPDTFHATHSGILFRTVRFAMSSVAVESRTRATLGFRVMQLMAGAFCMVAIANLQYGFTLFVEPINGKFHWGRPAIQVAFTLFILMETWLVPVEGWLIDKFGLRRLFLLAGVLVSAG